MAFLAGLLTQNPASPVAWKMYALATLIRIVSAGNATALQAWRLWAGGTVTNLWIQPQNSIASNVGAITDGTSAIVVYSGTRDGTQLLAQVGGSVQTSFLPNRGSVNSGQKLIWTRTQSLISDWLSANIAPGANVTTCGTSLGGACAAMMGNYLANAGYSTTVFTTGQPRVGTAAFNALVSPNWLRLINELDPVTVVPPAVDTMNVVINGVSSGIVQYEYGHGGVSQGMVLNAQNTADLFSPYDVNAAFAAGTLVSAFLSTLSFSNAFLQYHAIEQYIQKITRLKDFLQFGDPDIGPLQGINAVMDGILPQPPALPTASGMDPVTATELQDPNVVVQPPPQQTTIPPADVGRRAEARAMGVLPNPPQSNTPIFRIAQSGDGEMATGVKCTFMFRQLGQGWSETYVSSVTTVAEMLTAISTVNGPTTKLRTLGIAMMALRGPQCSLTSVRISEFTLPTPLVRPRVSYLYRFQPPINGAFPGADNDSDFFDTCIVLQMTTGGANPPKLSHCRGIPDRFVTNGGEPVSSLETFFGAGWTSPQTGLPAVLVGDGWRWVGRGTVRTAVISNVVQDASGTVTISTTDNTLLAGLAVGNVLPFRISGITRPRGINGVWPFSVNAGLLSITTKKLFGILDWDGGNQGRVRYDPKDARTISAVRFNNVGERKAGRPSDLQRGRQPNRSRN